MELNSQLLNEAVADAKAIRETAVQTAIARLTETFEPTVRELITTKLSEEEDEMEDEMEMEPEAPDTDVMDMEPEAPAQEAPEAPAPEAPAAEDPELDELEELLRELEAEDSVEEMADMDEYDVDLEEAMDGENRDMQDVQDEEDDIVTEADLDEIIAELEGSDMDDDMDDDMDEEVELMASGKKWKNENAKLKADLAEAMSVIKQQKEAISEVNLLNSKLLFLTKVTNKHKMTPNQQYKILEAFDRAQSVREVKLIYATIVENLTAPAEKSPKVRNSRNKLSEAASTPVRAIKRASKSNDSYDFAPRWKELANITK
jgi:hypothetical protein